MTRETIDKRDRYKEVRDKQSFRSNHYFILFILMYYAETETTERHLIRETETTERQLKRETGNKCLINFKYCPILFFTNFAYRKKDR